jgi:hypothetical protein
MGPLTSNLIGILGQLADVLEEDVETHWRPVIFEARARLEASDYSGIEHLLATYGGMGSFNDLVLGQSHANGVSAWKSGHKEINERLGALRTAAWKLAQQVKRHHESPRT